MYGNGKAHVDLLPILNLPLVSNRTSDEFVAKHVSIAEQ